MPLPGLLQSGRWGSRKGCVLHPPAIPPRGHGGKEGLRVGARHNPYEHFATALCSYQGY